MILRSGRRGREFDSPITPVFLGPLAGARLRWERHCGLIPQAMTLWPNWIGRETTNLEIGGSSPSRVAISSVGLVGYDDCLTRSRSPVRSRDRVLLGSGARLPPWRVGAVSPCPARGSLNQHRASVAQLAARGSHNPKVVGSIPTGGRLLAFGSSRGAVGSASVL